MRSFLIGAHARGQERLAWRYVRIVVALVGKQWACLSPSRSGSSLDPAMYAGRIGGSRPWLCLTLTTARIRRSHSPFLLSSMGRCSVIRANASAVLAARAEVLRFVE